MAATLSFQQARTQGGAAGSYTLTFTAASAVGQERLVALCGISSSWNDTTFGSVTIDGQSATQVGPYVRVSDNLSGTGSGPIVSLWRASGTSATSVGVSLTITAGSMYDMRGVLWTLNNAGTLLDTGSATIGRAGGDIGDLSLDLDTSANGAAVAVFMAYNSPSVHAATWTGLTERYDGTADILYTGDWFSAADANIGGASTPLTVTANLPTDFTGTTGAVGLSASFNPAASGTTLTAAAGAYTLTGSAAGLNATANLVFPAVAGAYVFTGTAATFLAGGNYTLFCNPGAYTLTGTAAAFPGYEPITPPVQPSTGGGYAGAVYDTYRLRKKRKRDELEELLDLSSGGAAGHASRTAPGRAAAAVADRSDTKNAGRGPDSATTQGRQARHRHRRPRRGRGRDRAAARICFRNRPRHGRAHGPRTQGPASHRPSDIGRFRTGHDTAKDEP